MNFKLIIPFLIVMVLTFWFCKPKSNKNGRIVNDWKQKVNNAKLTKELFSNATLEEKEDLIYYFTQKIRLQDNYGENSISKMPKQLKTVYLVNSFETEVNNGGFIQFFTNSTGKYTLETIESLELIGAKYNKGLLEKAVEVIVKNESSINELNKKLNSAELYKIFENSEIYDNEKLTQKLNELDNKFYNSTEKTQILKIEYFEKNSAGIWNEIKEKYGS